jgi:HlyD family secretion protein
MKKWLVIATIALVIALPVWLFFWKGTVNTSKGVKVQRMTLEDSTLASGSIVPRKEVNIKSQANGVIEEFFVEPGQWVKKGQLLAQVRLLADPVDINTTQSALNQARLESERESSELRRVKQLHQRHLLADSALDDQKLKQERAQESVIAAERNLELKLKGVSRQLATTSTRILATIDGMVLDRPIQAGDFVVKSNDLSPGTTVVTLADMSNLLFKGEVEEAAAGRLKPGMLITVTIGALPQESFAAILEYMAPKAKKTTQGRITFEIRAALKPKEGVLLRAGYSATGKIVFTSHEKVLAIPESHLQFRGEQPFVQIETAPDKREERRVDTGLSDGLNIDIIRGLQIDDKVLPAPDD